MKQQARSLGHSWPTASGPILTYLYLGALLTELVVSGLWMSRTAHDWGLPEWLINYQGGFIRRGMTGEVIRLVSKGTHLPALLVVAVTGILCYIVLFAAVRKLLAASSWQWWVYALVVCPATFAFPVIARTSFRKDILFFAGLGALVLWLRFHSASRSNDLWLATVLSFALPALILCQEPLFVYFPYCIAALGIFLPSWRRIFSIMVVPLLLSTAALAAVAVRRGNPEQARAICASLGTPLNGGCPSGVSIAGAPALDVARFIHDYGYWGHYPVDLVLCVIPVAGAYIALRKQAAARSSLRLLAISAATAVIGSLPLFALGVDWGRWINLHMISLTILLLAIDSTVSSTAPSETINVPLRERMRSPLAVALVLLLIGYATCWSMPGNRNRPLFGYISLGKTLLSGHRSLTD